MKKQRFLMNLRFLNRAPNRYKDNRRTYWGWGHVRDVTPQRPESWIVRILSMNSFSKRIDTYRKRDYKFYPRINSYYCGTFKNVYKGKKNPLQR